MARNRAIIYKDWVAHPFDGGDPLSYYKMRLGDVVYTSLRGGRMVVGFRTHLLSVTGPAVEEMRKLPWGNDAVAAAAVARRLKQNEQRKEKSRRNRRRSR